MKRRSICHLPFKKWLELKKYFLEILKTVKLEKMSSNIENPNGLP
jgi:hypothetical protein